MAPSSQLLSTPARARLSVTPAGRVLAVEVVGRVDPEGARRLLDRERQDRQLGEEALELLARHDCLGARDERTLRRRSLSRIDLVVGVEPALERGLGRSDRDALPRPDAGLRALIVGGEDQDLLVRVPAGPVAIVRARVHFRAQLLARDV